jgi:RND family efflux transporter MFP subunit
MSWRHLNGVLAMLLLAGCDDRAPPPVEDQAVRPARIYAVATKVAATTHEFVGRVEAAQTIDMTFRVPGPLVELPVREGQPLSSGALVAALDPTDYQLRLREAEVQLQLARQDMTRKQKLLREQGISRSIVDDAKALFDLRQVAVIQARENLQRTRLTAPFDAIVARRFIDNHVNVRVGDPIVRLMDLNELFVVANIPETLLATVTPERVLGVQARFSFAPDERFELTYRENTGESNAVAQTFEITFTMPRPEDWNILPGMTATVEVRLRPDTTGWAVQIPTSALVSDAEKQFFVWLYDPATQLVAKRGVVIGPATGGGISVRQGLEPGDLIVASGAAHLQPGMKVRMLDEPVADL